MKFILLLSLVLNIIIIKYLNATDTFRYEEKFIEFNIKLPLPYIILENENYFGYNMISNVYYFYNKEGKLIHKDLVKDKSRSYIFSVNKTKSGEYIFCGYIEDYDPTKPHWCPLFGGRILLLKTSENGEKIWNKEIKTLFKKKPDHEFEPWTTGYLINETDEGYIIIGQIVFNEALGDYLYFARIDKSADHLIGEEAYTNFKLSGNIYDHYVKLLNNTINGIIIGIESEILFFNNKGILKNYKFNNYVTLSFVTHNHDFIGLSVSYLSNVLLSIMNQYGETISSNTIKINSQSYTPYFGIESKDDLIIVGTSYDDSKYKLIVFKTTKNGNLIWLKEYDNEISYKPIGIKRKDDGIFIYSQYYIYDYTNKTHGVPTLKKNGIHILTIKE